MRNAFSLAVQHINHMQLYATCFVSKQLQHYNVKPEMTRNAKFSVFSPICYDDKPNSETAAHTASASLHVLISKLNIRVYKTIQFSRSWGILIQTNVMLQACVSTISFLSANDPSPLRTCHTSHSSHPHGFTCKNTFYAKNSNHECIHYLILGGRPAKAWSWSLHTVSSLRLGGATTLLPPYAFVEWTGITLPFVFYLSFRPFFLFSLS